jgi:hypothetical protein
VTRPYNDACSFGVGWLKRSDEERLALFFLGLTRCPEVSSRQLTEGELEALGKVQLHTQTHTLKGSGFQSSKTVTEAYLVQRMIRIFLRRFTKPRSLPWHHGSLGKDVTDAVAFRPIFKPGWISH